VAFAARSPAAAAAAAHEAKFTAPANASITVVCLLWKFVTQQNTAQAAQNDF